MSDKITTMELDEMEARAKFAEDCNQLLDNEDPRTILLAIRAARDAVAREAVEERQ